MFGFFLLYLRVFFFEFFNKVFASADKSLIDETMQKIYAVIQDYLLGLIKVICMVGTLIDDGRGVNILMQDLHEQFFFGCEVDMFPEIFY